MKTFREVLSAQCCDCIFWCGKHWAHDVVGECRRYPPVREYLDEMERDTTPCIGYYVLTREGDWCGEFVARD